MRLRPAERGYGRVLLLILATYLLALVPGDRWFPAVLLVLQAATVWQALRMSGARPAVRAVAAAVVALALAATASAVLAPGTTLIGLTFLTAGALSVIAPVSIVRDIGVHRRVDRQTMLGALAAYLLIGMAFGFAYACLGALQTGPLFGDAGDPALPQSLFFSFVTLTTTGYGDLVPAANPAQSLAVLEALIGQLFLVTAVAKVVENWRPRGWQQDGGKSGDAAAPPP
ncbi:potassium channel family protein [Pseudosporangium ferrugineum]|uniref:Ion channel n=1 Tax=Pseudosporangium ferrugineum TaxID=439699 RepID=A0A2T0SBZ6_9ACTN|nr:potassium channel family protein [Pseudosporangium ferrugineum]PRY30843.1 ion channel [Pseudosporangium ferrugineum]